MTEVITIRTKELHIKIIIESLDVNTHSLLTGNSEAVGIAINNAVSQLTANLKAVVEK